MVCEEGTVCVPAGGYPGSGYGLAPWWAVEGGWCGCIRTWRGWLSSRVDHCGVWRGEEGWSSRAE